MRLMLLPVLLLAAGCGPGEVRVAMNSDSNSGQTGFAVLTEQNGKLTVVVETSAPDVSDGQLAHIHEGACGEVGNIIASLNKLTPLDGSPGRFGSTTPNLPVTFAQLKASPHVINVHDARDSSVYVSCGTIRVP